MAGRNNMKVELTPDHPDLSSLGVSPEAVERYGVVVGRTNLGRRIAIPYLEDCTKLLTWDGAHAWDGDFVPQVGLFGQRCAIVRTFILCAHEFEALRLASVIASDSKLSKRYHAVSIAGDGLGRLGMAVMIDSLKITSDRILVWGGSDFNSQREAAERFVTALDESGVIEVSSLSLSRLNGPLSLSDEEIRNVLSGSVRKWRPANLASVDEIMESTDFFARTIGVSTGIKGLDKMIMGLRFSELIMLVAGTGVGKSTLLRIICYHLAFRENKKVALGFFEETKEETLRNMACIHFGVSYGELRRDPHKLSDKQWQEFRNLPACRNLHFISQPDDGFGGMEVDTLLATVRYLKRKESIEFVAIDHISIMVSGKESSREGERKDIDIMMTKLAMACVILRIGILAVCHLSNPDGTPHEEGGRVLLRHLRGSGSLKQLAWGVIAQERNQQADNNRTVLLRALKNRNGGGVTGLCAALEFRDPLLVELEGVDLRELSANMGNPSSQPASRGKRTPQPTHTGDGGLFGADKPGRKVTFGKLGDSSSHDS